MKKESNLVKKILKVKKLQKLSNDSLGMIIPGSWIRSMDWNRKILFALEFHPLDKEIIIREYGKEADSPITE